MTETGFDPYRDWLGLHSPPANAYELLGLPDGEADADRISSAAARAIARLRSVRPGPRQAAWKELLDELEAARQSLLGGRQSVATVDPMAPVDFAHASSARTSHGAGQPSVATVRPTPDGSRLDLPPAGLGRSRRLRTAARSRRRRPSRSLRGLRPATAYGLFALCFAAVLVAFVGVIYWRIVPARELRRQLSASIPQSAADLPLPLELEQPSGRAGAIGDAESVDAEPIDRVERPIENPTEPRPLERLHSTGMPAPVEEPAAETDPTAALAEAPAELVAQIDRILREVFEALCERRWADAEQGIRGARSLAASTTEEPRVERFATLADYAQQYYQAAVDGMEDLAGSELVVGERRVFVVELSSEEIVIRADGRNRRFPRDRLPTQLLMAIADRWFDQRATTTSVFRGAFMLVTPPRNAEEVRALWQAAARSGVALEDLLPVIDEVESPGAD